MLKRFRKTEDGTATIEFVILFPLFMSIFLMGFEAGYYMVRNVMLERGLDMAVRDVRLGNGRIPELKDFKNQICENAGIFYGADDEDSCIEAIQIEMREVDMTPGGLASVQGDATCIDLRQDDSVDQTKFGSYDLGETNKVIVVRACFTASPLFPTTGIGLGMTRPEAIGDNYALVATSSFVTEPGTRAMASSQVPTSVAKPNCDAGTGDGSAGCDSGNSGANNNAGDELDD